MQNNFNWGLFHLCPVLVGFNEAGVKGFIKHHLKQNPKWTFVKGALRFSKVEFLHLLAHVFAASLEKVKARI